MNYTSTANIEEVMKFYNLGDKTFETNFKSIEGVIPPPIEYTLSPKTKRSYQRVLVNKYEKIKELQSLNINHYLVTGGLIIFPDLYNNIK